jgi:hypothetical protein
MIVVDLVLLATVAVVVAVSSRPPIRLVGRVDDDA